MQVLNRFSTCLLSACLALAVSVPALAGPPGSGGTFIADLNGDGISDLIIVEDATNVLVGYILNDLGEITDQGAIVQLPLTYGVQAFADTDGDAKADLIIFDLAGNYLRYGMDGLTIQLPANAITTLNPTTWTVVGLANIDGENGADIVASRVRGNGDLVIHGLLLGADGYTVSTQGDIINPLAVAFAPTSLADVDANGTADLVTYRDSDGFYFGFGLDGLTADAGHSMVAVGGDWIPSSMGDVNGDGNTDLLIFNTVNRLVYVFALGAVDGWQPRPGEGAAIVQIPVIRDVAGSGNYDGVQDAKSTSDLLLTSSTEIFTFFLDTSITGSKLIMGLPPGYSNVDDQGVIEDPNS